MKFESDKHVVCGGSCSECERCLRLYLLDAEVWAGISVWRTSPGYASRSVYDIFTGVRRGVSGASCNSTGPVSARGSLRGKWSSGI